MDIQKLINLTNAFSNSAHNILSKHETSKSRVIVLEDTYKKLESLSIKQDDLFRQSLRCMENELYRAAHLMAWAGLVDFFEEVLVKSNFIQINKVRAKWNIKSIYDLREKFPDSQIIDAMRDANYFTKNDSKSSSWIIK
jgi:hypothetical protein